MVGVETDLLLRKTLGIVDGIHIIHVIHIVHGRLVVEPLALVEAGVHIGTVHWRRLRMGLHSLWTLEGPLWGHMVDLGSAHAEVAILSLLKLITNQRHIIVGGQECLKRKYIFVQSDLLINSI